MTTPTPRTPVRPGRGLKAALDTALAAGDIKEGEIVYAKDEDKLYMVEGGVFVPAGGGSSVASIDDLTDVDTSTSAPTDGQVLTWVAANNQWKPASLPTQAPVITGTPPVSASATGTAGELRFDTNYLYVCIAANSWKRTLLDTWISLFFSVQNYTGNASARSITGVGFQPGMIWIDRNSGDTGFVYDVAVFDVQSGATKFWDWRSTNALATDATTLTSFNADGFSLGNSTGVNNSGTSFTAFCFSPVGSSSSNTSGTITTTTRVSTNGEYSMFTYTGNGTQGATIGHGLAGTPELVITKVISGTVDYAVAYVPALGATGYMAINSNAAYNSADGNRFRGASATTVTLGTSTGSNGNTRGYAGYAFRSVPGVSKIATINGDGSGVLAVNCGFQPKMILMKMTTGTGDWELHRGSLGYTTVSYGNTTAAWATSTEVQITANGFSVDAQGIGNVTGSTETAVYMALA